MRLLRFFPYSFLLIGCVYLNAQPASTQKLLPVLAPPSPEAASFQRYGNYQVNLFTGIPDISIPLYEIKVGELRVPISISYHSSGIKVNDIPSRVGLGWDLQAGGSITRKIMGKPDELSGNYLSATSTSGNRVRLQSEIDPNTQDGLDYLENVNNGVYDVEPDIYSYSFPGHGGKFLFNQKNNFTPILIPFAPVQVNWSKPSQSTLSLGMTDEGGNVYKFDTQEGTSSGGGMSTTCTSAWLLSDMYSANQQDAIHFKYTAATRFESMTTNYSDYVVLSDGCTGSYTPDGGLFYSDASGVATSWQQLTEIDFQNGKIVFEQAPEARQDFSGIYGFQHRLTAMKIYSLDAKAQGYSLIKTIQFLQSYFISGTDATTQRLRLDALQILGSDGQVVENYSFGYNTTVALPSNLSRSKDYWGYYNNMTNLQPNGLPTMVPKMQVTLNSPYNGQSTIFIGGNNANARDPDPNYMQADILQKITYPTGGFTQFEYETNKYLDDQGNSKYAGGLRIKSIKSLTDINAVPVVKSYRYGLNESGYGRSNFLLEDHFFVSIQNVRKGQDTYTTTNGATLCSGVPNTKTIRTYFADPTNDLESYDGAPVVYSTVTEYTGDEITNTGKTVYTFSDITDAKTSIVGLGKSILTSYHFERGLLKDRTDYRVNPAGASTPYTIVAENKKNYQFFPYQNSTGGIGMAVYKRIFTENGGNKVGLSYNTGCEIFNDNNSFQYNNYEIITGDNKIVSDEIISYDQNDITKISSALTTYTYDDVTHLQVTRKQTTGSKNEILAAVYTYPYNYTIAPYSVMTATHIFNKVVTEAKAINSNPLTLQTTNYANFAGNNYLPSNIQLQIRSNTPEFRANFNQYDLRGNILEMQKTGDMKQSYVWDYALLNPIAEVKNASQSDIAYTSFESDGYGNWTGIIAANISADPNAITGTKDYLLTGTTIQRGVNTGVAYTVSYWSKNGSYNVNGVQAVKGRTRTINGNSWTYYEHKVSSVTTISITGTGVIDELRLYPQSAFMTSYTYLPLIGQSSMSDPNGEITYYEYDSYTRLKNIKDYQGNIVKNYQYNYQNSCGTNCVILPMQTFNGSNTIGYPVGVFNVNGQLLGTAYNQTDYINIWKLDLADQSIGVLAPGIDALHFNLSLSNGQAPPNSLTGLRFYQVDLDDISLDAVRTFNAELVDFGDGTNLRLGNSFNTNALPARTVVNYFPGNKAVPYIVHTYQNSNLKTVTFYHNDGSEFLNFDNFYNPATSLGKFKNLRGNLPQYLKYMGGSSYQDPTYLTVSGITNWNTIGSLFRFSAGQGDGINPWRNLNFAQDFLQNSKGLSELVTTGAGYSISGIRDLNFKLSKLKSDWNTYFSELKVISINEDHWNHEDLSSLKKLNNFTIVATRQNHLNDNNSLPIPLDGSVIDNILIQIAAGSAQTVNNGSITIISGGTTRGNASDVAYNFLLSKGWTVTIVW